MSLVSEPIWIFDLDRSRVHWANRAAVAIWGASTLDELCARDMGADMSPAVAHRLLQYRTDFTAHDASFNEQWTLYPKGEPTPLVVRVSGHRLADGRMAMLCHAKAAAAAAPEQLRSLEALLHTAVMITMYLLDGTPLYRNPAARASARSHEQALSDRVADGAIHKNLMEAMRAGEIATATLAVRTAQGERWHELSARPCWDPVTGKRAMLVSEADVSALKRTEAHARFLALHDTLTGLPNRAQVIERFSAAVALLQEAGSEAALISIDLDGFKSVNDTLGHGAGDALLVQVAERLRAVTRSTDMVARLGGDEFLILVVSEEILAEVARVCGRVAGAVAMPVSLSGVEVSVTPSMGVSIYPRDGLDLDTLMRKADMAMYASKERGRNSLSYYQERMGTAASDRATMEAQLRGALDRDQFELHYEPIVCVATHRVVGAEARLHWRHPQRGLLGPEVFMALCESTGLIHPIGRWVFDTALRQQVDWARRGWTLNMSANLPPSVFRDPDVVRHVEQALHLVGGDATAVTIGIKESQLFGNDEELARTLASLAGLGLSFALDDFGTGSSNLARLHKFPIKTLKIDKSFIQVGGSERPPADLIVSMCKALKLGIVAEGVETQEQLDWVRGRGIDRFQGSLFSMPVPAQAFGGVLDAAGHPVVGCNRPISGPGETAGTPGAS